jgi:hypothetical protein
VSARRGLDFGEFAFGFEARDLLGAQFVFEFSDFGFGRFLGFAFFHRLSGGDGSALMRLLSSS